MKIELPPIPDAERTPLVESLLACIDALQVRIQLLDEIVQGLRDEIAVLKGQKPKPKIAPSRLNQSEPKSPSDSKDGKRPGSAKRSKTKMLPVTEELTVMVPDPPAGSTHHGYEEFVVQDLVIHAKVTRYLRQRIRLADGTTQLAPLPADLRPGSHFGPTLITWILNEHYQGCVTQPLILEQLEDWGIDMSAGQLSHLLTENLDAFHQEKADVLTAGLQTATYIGVDDTGARHDGKNGFCTAIGNDLFAYFESTDSKSRENFLTVLRGPTSTSYTINEYAMAYWQKQKLSKDLVDELQAGPTQFADVASWEARLTEVGATSDRHVRIATEGALLGQVIEQGVSPDLVVLSDAAGQFDIFKHAACWVHMERPLARAIPYHDEHRAALELARDQVWGFYKELKVYREKPDPTAKADLEEKFDALVNQKSNYSSSIGLVWTNMKESKPDLLRILEVPEVPLHNNASESDIRCYVKVRKISGGTRSDLGRKCRDTFASVRKTCRKLGVSFWEYLKDRVTGKGQVSPLGELIRARADANQAEAVPI